MDPHARSSPSASPARPRPQVVIFAGGWGTRLGRLGERIPKPMVELGGKPMLWHVMSIYARAGFEDFVVLLGARGDVIRNWFANFQLYSRDCRIDLASGERRWLTPGGGCDWTVTLAETGLDTLKGGRLKRAERYLAGDEVFLTYGDGLADVDLAALLAFHREHGRLLTITGVHPPSRFGEIRQRDGVLQSFEEKPRTSDHFINGGFMVFERELLARLSPTEDCDFESGVVQELVREGQVAMYRHEGRWACVDHERDLAEIEELMQRGDAFWLAPEGRRPALRQLPLLTA